MSTTRTAESTWSPAPSRSAWPERLAGMVTALTRTDRDGTALLLRLTLALVILPHGAQKLLGWFGGSGFDGTMSFLTGMMGLPAALAILVILVESVGALALAVGFLGRLAAVGIGAVMIGAVATTHWTHGFFMNWSGTQAGEGFEFHLLALGIALAVAIRGSGALSVDRVLTEAAGE